jgi:putative ABC transport system ATP-binding protein
VSTIEVKELVKTFGEGDNLVTAVDNISFTITMGEFVALMGESGAGKSSLLAIMGAMNAPTSGSYVVDDLEVYHLTSEQRADFRREYLGFVFQSFHLVPYLTVLENTMLPLTSAKLNRTEKRHMAMRALDWVGLADKAKRLPNQISGGEGERCAIARAIVNEPPILLADEPTGNLDSNTSGEIMALLKRLHHQGTTIIMVTHSMVCAQTAHRIIEIKDGRLIKDNNSALNTMAAA